MTNNKCHPHVQKYLASLELGFTASHKGESCHLTSPFRRQDGEFIELEIRPTEGALLVSDMGDSLGYLHVNGLLLGSALMRTAATMARTFNARFDHGELTAAAASSDSVGEAVDHVLQAAINVSGLIHKRRYSSWLRFNDEVEAFMITQGISYDVNYLVKGRHKKHSIAFHVDSGRRVLVQPLSCTTEPRAFSWTEKWGRRLRDILSADPAWKPVVVLDDRGERAKLWTERTRRPLEEVATMVQWAERNELGSLLEHR